MSKLREDRAKRLTRSTSIEAGLSLPPAPRYDTFTAVDRNAIRGRNRKPQVRSSGPLMPDPLRRNALPPGFGLLSVGIIIATGHEKSRLG